MLRRLFVFTAIVLVTNALVFAQTGSGALKGKITDKDTKEAIPFASVVIEQGGKQFGGVNSDLDGNYTIKPLPAGKYDVKAVYVGYKPLMIDKVVINNDQITFLDIQMEKTSQTLKEFVVKDYEVPLISKDQTATGGTMTSDEMSKMPGRSAESVAVTVGGVYQDMNGNMGGIRGSRSEGTAEYIDGVKVLGSTSLPQADIEEVQVITGGLPAQYGDATGGVINITTKGAAREFGAGVEAETSEFLDGYGYNLIGFNAQGPLIKGKDSTAESSLLGYFISGELTSIENGNLNTGSTLQTNNDPSAIGSFIVNPATLMQLQLNPLRPSGTSSGTYTNSSFVTADDIQKMKAKQNALDQGIDLSGKFDVRTTPTINLTFGGSIDYTKSNAWSYSNSLFNNENNPELIDDSWRVWGRFTQRFPTEKDSKSAVKNVYYSIEVSYSKDYSVTEASQFGNDFFDYGYVGKFKTYKEKTYQLGNDTALHYNNVMVQNGFKDTLVTFQRSEINSDLANYTSAYYNLYPRNSGYYASDDEIQSGSNNFALLNGQTPASVYGLYNNTGTVFNGYGSSAQPGYGGYSIKNNSTIGINADGSADIKNHAIQFGLQYQQDIDAGYDLDPVSLWTLMREQANSHIAQLNESKNGAHPVYNAEGVFQDTIQYDRLVDTAHQSFFDYNLRKKLGLNPYGQDWIDIDNLDPSTFSISMFSPDELLNNGNQYVSYYGYDYTGKRITGKPTLDDFFNSKDAFGNYTRGIGAFEPIYMAGYVQDKFAFNDLLFNVGVRVDRYDANQEVPKDPYCLYPVKTVSEVSASDLNGNQFSIPSNMGNNYVVYVNDVKNPTSIVGYRNGSTWYNAQGAEITDPSVLETASGIAPLLADPANQTLTANSFAQYNPQINVMPRISFSFPISDVALFFAHYDVLTQRPTAGTDQFLPTNYLFMQSLAAGTIVNNPNLLPQKTTDFELGFQQKLSNSSSLKFSAFYRDMKDEIEAFRYVDAYPVTYTSYSNIDFGTVKGATLSYDLRRTNNVWIKANYTLQFADGTGSSATSGLNLVTSGQPNLRTTMPLDYDRRHTLSCVVDYRYSEGKHYNGPVWTRKIKGSDKVKTIALLQNTGINFTLSGGSGVPYSRSSEVIPVAVTGNTVPVLQGTLNGSRLPWQFKIDARLDKDIKVKLGNKDSKNRKDAYVNIYLQVLNLLNTKNIMVVYAATGNPNDDGYLSAAMYQAAINEQLNVQSYRELYSLYINNPSNYSLPRRIRLGATFDF
jgi:outer membrane receptor protein involved in Fe transport